MSASKAQGVILAALFCLCALSGGGLLLYGDVDHHPFRLLIAIFLVLAAASILARPLVYLLTRGVGGLLFPGSRHLKPPPAYSPAQARRLQGDYEGAMRLFEAIVREYPQEITAWRSMLEIALENLGDPQRARSILNEGLVMLADDHHRGLLQDIYNEAVVTAAVRQPIRLS